MSEQTLTSLAILTVNWNHGHDTIDSFVPLVANCIRQNGDQPVSLVELQQEVKDEAGIKIPSGALEAILRRCAKRGLVQKKQKVYHPQRKKLDKLRYAPMRGEAERQHGCLIGKLQAFAQDRYGFDWSEADATRHLLAFLQQGSVPVLAAATEGDPLPGEGREQAGKAKHVLSSFARHLAEADAEGFECLETVVKGFILSGVLFYPDLRDVQTRFDQLEVYCDTPFLLRALGYAEEGLRLQCLDLIELLRELGANLKCFHHTREEVVGVLEAEAASIRAGVGPSNATSMKFRADEIEEMVIKIDRTLGGLGIEVIDTPTWTKEPDEVALEDALKKKIDYARDKAREKDVLSLAAVARLRSLRRMDKLEDAKAIFVTTNTSLARASSTFFQDIEGRGAVPVCMPSDLMTRLAWVKKPLSAPDLPKHVVMALSYAALNPPIALWRRYLAEIERRRERGEISDDEYHLLRSSKEARAALMDETFGEEQAFSAGTLDEVLAHARAAVQAEERARTEQERVRTEEERQGRVAAEKEAQDERDARVRIEGAHGDRVDRRARALGRFTSWGLAGILTIAVIVGCAATISGAPLVEIEELFWRVLIWICIGAFIALTLWALVIKGVAVREIRDSLASSIEARLQARGHRKLDELHSRARSEAGNT